MTKLVVRTNASMRINATSCADVTIELTTSPLSNEPGWEKYTVHRHASISETVSFTRKLANRCW